MIQSNLLRLACGVGSNPFSYLSSNGAYYVSTYSIMKPEAGGTEIPVTA